jgi:hypothetical protein
MNAVEDAEVVRPRVRDRTPEVSNADVGETQPKCLQISDYANAFISNLQRYNQARALEEEGASSQSSTQVTPRSILKRSAAATVSSMLELDSSFDSQSQPSPSAHVADASSEEQEAPPTPVKTKAQKGRALARRREQIEAWKKLKEREDRSERITKRRKAGVERSGVLKSDSSKVKWTGANVEIGQSKSVSEEPEDERLSAAGDDQEASREGQYRQAQLLQQSPE